LETTVRPRRLNPIINDPSSIINSRAFTLIELLVVIGIIALLMAILLPIVQRVRSQAQAVVCQAHLRQWGVVFALYLNDNDGRLPSTHTVIDISKTSGVRGTPGIETGSGSSWESLYAMDAHLYGINPKKDFILCPTARRWQFRPDDHPQNDSRSGNPVVEHILGSKSTAWCERYTSSSPASAVTELSGSYGFNLWGLTDVPLDKRYPGACRPNAPFLLDCISMGARAMPTDKPPAYDGEISSFPSGGFEADMKFFCINRHSGGVNSLFFDWSVRKVGLKELWTLTWHPLLGTTDKWTKAGGVQPEDWPQWMRQFKDY